MDSYQEEFWGFIPQTIIELFDDINWEEQIFHLDIIVKTNKEEIIFWQGKQKTTDTNLADKTYSAKELKKLKETKDLIAERLSKLETEASKSSKG